jgi:hypothetical protein
MLIVEGPDGAGKTTLIKRLEPQLRWPVAERVVSKDAEAQVDLKAWVEENLETLKPKQLIYDRHRMISEPIYGPILRGILEPGFNDRAWYSYYKQRFEACHPFVIWCMPPLGLVRANVERDPDNKVVSDRITEIYWLYHLKIAEWYAIGGYGYVWNYTVYNDSMDLLRQIHSWKERYIYNA